MAALLWVATTPEAGQVIKLTPWVRTKVDGNPSDPGSAPSVPYQDNSKAVRINNGDSNPVPVRVGAGYGRHRQPREHAVDRLLVAQIQHKKGLYVRRGWRNVRSCGEFQVARPRLVQP